MPLALSFLDSLGLQILFAFFYYFDLDTFRYIDDFLGWNCHFQYAISEDRLYLRLIEFVSRDIVLLFVYIL